MARPRSRKRAQPRIDEAELAAFRAGLRRRYTDEEILEELRAAAARHGRSPTMREFARDAEARVHPQTVIEHFGTWNAAKRAAGLFPRRFLTRDELLEQLRRLGEELEPNTDRPRPGRAPAVGARPYRSMHTPSALSRTRCERRDSKCYRARSGSNARSCRAPSWREASGASPRWPTGPKRGARIPAALRVAGLSAARRPAWRMDRLSVSRARATPGRPRRRAAGREAGCYVAGAVRSASRSRHDTPSCGARTGGR